MCDPFSVTAGLVVTQTGTKFVQQSQHAKDQVEFAEERSKITTEAIREDAISRFSSLGRRSEQETEAAGQAITEITRQAMEASGVIMATSGASGVEGGSIDALLGDFRRQELARVRISETNLDNTIGQIEEEKKAVAAGSRDRLFQSRAAPVQRPNPLNALFEIGGGILNSYLSNSSVDPETGERTLNDF